MADAVSDNFSGRLETEVTSMSMSSSTLNLFSLLGGGRDSCVCAKASLAKMTRTNVMKVKAQLRLGQSPREFGRFRLTVECLEVKLFMSSWGEQVSTKPCVYLACKRRVTTISMCFLQEELGFTYREIDCQYLCRHSLTIRRSKH